MTSSRSLTTSKISAIAGICAQPLSQSNKLFQAHSLSADLRGQIRGCERVSKGVGVPISLEQLEHHFSPLRKAAFHDSDEVRSQFRREERLLAAAQRDTS